MQANKVLTIEDISYVIKQKVIIENLELTGITAGDIQDTEPIFGEGLGLESVDTFYIVKGIEKEFGMKVDIKKINSLRKHFYSVATLAQYVLSHLQQTK
ncbi:phosphopantetheine-binding protein [Peribacillus sp. NPDC096448]|uniref:phosphopantetheine-binding protein n=1 Tax=Peribacillus sp. NPDC096448 TaxID=3364395 RepID=UPI0026FB3568|nr:phosphopantetheine-binding protein [Peribacillus frigoritolerans]